MLKKSKPASPILAAYTEGFVEFGLLTELIKDQDARETLEVVWNAAPRTNNEKQRVLYLLVRPIEQAAEVRQQSMPASKRSIASLTPCGPESAQQLSRCLV